MKKILMGCLLAACGGMACLPSSAGAHALRAVHERQGEAVLVRFAYSDDRGAEFAAVRVIGADGKLKPSESLLSIFDLELKVSAQVHDVGQKSLKELVLRDRVENTEILNYLWDVATNKLLCLFIPRWRTRWKRRDRCVRINLVPIVIAL